MIFAEFQSSFSDFPFSFLVSHIRLKVLSGSKPPSLSLLTFRLRFRISRSRSGPILFTQYQISWVRALPLACILLNSTKKPQLGDRSSYEILFGNDYSQISVISTPGTEWGNISSNSAPVASYARNRKRAIRPDNR